MRFVILEAGGSSRAFADTAARAFLVDSDASLVAVDCAAEADSVEADRCEVTSPRTAAAEALMDGDAVAAVADAVWTAAVAGEASLISRNARLAPARVVGGILVLRCERDDMMIRCVVIVAANGLRIPTSSMPSAIALAAHAPKRLTTWSTCVRLLVTGNGCAVVRNHARSGRTLHSSSKQSHHRHHPNRPQSHRTLLAAPCQT